MARCLPNTDVLFQAVLYHSQRGIAASLGALRGLSNNEIKTYARGTPRANTLAANLPPERPALGNPRGDLGLPVWPAVL